MNPGRVRRSLRWALALLALVAVGCGDRSDAADAERPEPTPSTTLAPTTTVETTTTIPSTTLAPTTTSSAPEAVGDPLVGPDGRPRTWHLHVPPDLEPGAPLVVALHGAGGSGTQLRNRIGYDALADEAGFAVVFPDATGVLPTWNAGRCCPPTSLFGTDDVAFVEALVDRLVAEWDLDPDRVYATGHSNGAMLTHRLICESDRFAAGVAVAGALEIDCDRDGSSSILHVHGTADWVVPYDERTTGVFGLPFTPVPESFAGWSARRGCDAEPRVEVEGVVTTSTSTGCRDGAVVSLVTIDGWEHDWPGPDDPVDATAFGWAFMSAHRR